MHKLADTTTNKQKTTQSIKQSINHTTKQRQTHTNNHSTKGAREEAS